jgi:hypothetical protein
MIQPIRLYGTAVLALAACLASGCGGGKSNPVVPPTNGVPRASSPDQALRRLEYAWDNRDPNVYRDLFTSDFTFAFVPGDSAGIPFQVTPWSRDDELTSFNHLVNGGNASQPAATSIQLALAGTLIVNDDPRPGKNPRWHKTINSSVVLIANFTGGNTSDITGTCDWFFTRGDSALIPIELGLGPDTTLWYIDHWKDHTAPVIGPGPLRAAPTRVLHPTPITNNSWGRLKAQYR